MRGSSRDICLRTWSVEARLFSMNSNGCSQGEEKSEFGFMEVDALWFGGVKSTAFIPCISHHRATYAREILFRAASTL